MLSQQRGSRVVDSMDMVIIVTVHNHDLSYEIYLSKAVLLK